jgi:2-polyprenyl-3-methyl-5-hydroxy-6-metoxy-1,4-benzoquinol methylase
MSARDAFRFINDLDAATLQAVIDRLEFRGRDPTFCRLRNAYLDRLPLAGAREVLDLGCGTGVVGRGLARRDGFTGRVIGLDQSPALIEAGRRFAAAEGVAERIAFRTGAVHAIDYEADRFDVVIAHTLISHVSDPLAVLRESARVVTPDGTIAIFDGDYASLTFAHPDSGLAKAMEEALIAAVVNNPRVIRDLPRLLPTAGLEIVETTAHVYAEAGTGDFFPGLARSYAPLVARAGLLPAEQVETWLAEQRRAAAEGTFFAACNYYTYLVRRVRGL